MGCHPAQILEKIVTSHNAVVVEKRGKRIDFSVAGATFATWHPDHYLTGYSWDALTKGCLLFPHRSPSSILLLGLAGGTVARQLRRLVPDVKLSAVEIDPDVVELGYTYMELGDLEINISIGDAYRFLHHSTDVYDVIADDVYVTGLDDVERPPLAWSKWLDIVENRLTPNGIAVANFVTGDHHDAIYENAKRHFTARFSQTRVIAPPRGYNQILVGGRRLNTPKMLTTMRARLGRKHDRDLWDRTQVSRLDSS